MNVVVVEEMGADEIARVVVAGMGNENGRLAVISLLPKIGDKVIGLVHISLMLTSLVGASSEDGSGVPNRDVRPEE